MGLLKAGLGAAGGVMADQWKEFIYCESMPADVLACKGSKRTGGRSSNTRGEDNVISNGSVIAVNDGQGMLVVQNGKIIEVALEPGEFVFDTGSEPSVFSGNLGDSIKETFANIGSRFTFGGDAGKDQRVYFINTKEIIGNKYGTASPVPFRAVDNNIGLDVDISVRCNGEYSYRITNPLLFYTNVCGNVTDSYTRDKIDSQLKSELLTALQPAFAKISEMGIRYSAIPGHTTELARALNEVLSADWRDLRGVEIVSFGVNSIAASQEDEQMIKDLQKAAVMRDPTMAAANIASAQSDAMRAAAANPNGAMAGFMGMGMAGGMGGMNASQLFAAGQAQQQAAPQPAPAPAPVAAAPAPAPAPRAAAPVAVPHESVPADPFGRKEERVPMTRLRRRVAERLVQSLSGSAQLTTFNEVDMSAAIALRSRYKEKFERRHGIKLGFMSFFVKAAVYALQKYPVLNASIDETDIIYHSYFDIGVAVGTERGLVVPVVRNADQKSFAEIELEIADYAKRAKDGKLTIEELSGGTFTVSNGGVFGSMLSTPIINPPQSAILGIHATRERPVVVDGQIVIRPMNYLALSYDHRLIDGREAVLGLVAMKQALEDPAVMLLDI